MLSKKVKVVLVIVAVLVIIAVVAYFYFFSGGSSFGFKSFDYSSGSADFSKLGSADGNAFAKTKINPFSNKT